MKKLVSLLAALVLFGAALGAQEEAANPAEADGGGQAVAEQDTAGQEAAGQGGTQQQMPGMPAPRPNVMSTFGLGDLKIDGMIVTGIGIKKDDGEMSLDQTTGEWTDSEWRLAFINPQWQENRFELDLHYDAGQLPGGVKFGWFATMWAQNYGAGNFTWAEFPVGEGGRKMTAPDWNQPWVELRYAGLWTSFMEDKVKLTVGRTYDEFYYMPGSKVWKTDGFPFRFTDEKTISMRLELKPVAGLNFGVQWFAMPPSAGNEAMQAPVLWPTAEDAIKEIGLGVQYQNSLFNIVGGIRFDGDGDPMSKDEAKTYLSSYYGDGGNSIRLWKYDMHNYMEQIPAGTAYSRIGPYYKHLDEIMEDPDHFEDGAWTFFSFNWKGTPRLGAVVYGALYNITKFDWYGYGKFGENISYEIVPQKFTAGINFSQEFYGSDVFPDKFTITEMGPTGPPITATMVNSPYFKFTPQVSYTLIPNMMSVALEGSYGICKDVLEYDYSVMPSVNMSLGMIQVSLFYQFASQKFKTDNPLVLDEALNVHTGGIGFMMMF
jgi:hypothetical protein